MDRVLETDNGGIMKSYLSMFLCLVLAGSAGSEAHAQTQYVVVNMAPSEANPVNWRDIKNNDAAMEAIHRVLAAPKP
jgi:hypothetical protein